MKKVKLVYGKSYIFGFFFYMKNSLIPLSFPSHSGFSQIHLIPLSFNCHSPHSVSPHFPCHSPIIPQFIRFPLISPHSPLIPLSFGFPSFPSFCFSNSPVNPLGFPSFSFPSCIPSSLSVVLSWLFSLGSLSLPLFSLDSLSPFPCSLKKQDNITDSRGKGQEG